MSNNKEKLGSYEGLSTFKEVKETIKADNWDVTLNQLVNGMFEVETYIVYDAEWEDYEGVSPEFTFSSEYKPRVFLHPKYAFAKVTHCECISKGVMKVYIKFEEEQRCAD